MSPLRSRKLFDVLWFRTDVWKHLAHSSASRKNNFCQTPYEDQTTCPTGDSTPRDTCSWRVILDANSLSVEEEHEDGEQAENEGVKVFQDVRTQMASRTERRSMLEIMFHEVDTRNG